MKTNSNLTQTCLRVAMVLPALVFGLVAPAANITWTNTASGDWNTVANWKPNTGSALFVHNGNPISTSPVLVGYASSTGYLGYAQMNWSILILQSTAKAFLPIHTLWAMFSVVIILTLLPGKGAFFENMVTRTS